MSELQERLAANIVTSDNLAEFTAQKLGLVDTPANEAASDDANSAAAEPDAQADQSEQDGEADDATATEEPKEKNNVPLFSKRELKIPDYDDGYNQALQDCKLYFLKSMEKIKQNLVSLDPSIVKIVDDNFWELLKGKSDEK